jgi:16S rRNA (cytosine1402-N4)-methyltransferase
MGIEHQPVLLDEVVKQFQPIPAHARLCDATFGGGGHTAALLELCVTCEVTAIDADREMIRRGRERFAAEERLSLRHGWFDEELPRLLGQDRILMDVGLSMFHLRESARGFSLREDGPLDMRLDQDSGMENASEYLRRVDERELADVLFKYGEERYARRIAAAVVRERGAGPSTTAELENMVWRAVPAKYRHGRIHPATRTFQAIRIVINDELGRIERAIPSAARALRAAGRLAIITFHSLEDRITKHTFRALADPERPKGTGAGSTSVPDIPIDIDGGRFRVITKKPIVPSEAEVRRNPAARSAKLRVLERVRDED